MLKDTWTLQMDTAETLKGHVNTLSITTNIDGKDFSPKINPKQLLKCSIPSMRQKIVFKLNSLYIHISSVNNQIHIVSMRFNGKRNKGIIKKVPDKEILPSHRGFYPLHNIMPKHTRNNRKCVLSLHSSLKSSSYYIHS